MNLMKMAHFHAVLCALALLVVNGCQRSSSTETSSQSRASSQASSDACKACQAKHCSAVVAACTSKECLDVRSCIRTAKCADPKRDNSLVPCYCGSADQDDCFFAKIAANGPCKSVMEAGAKSSNALEIGQRYFDMAYPAGQAVQLTSCEQTFCKECL